MCSLGTPGKPLSNLKKHGVSFEEAATVFSDAEALDWEDPEHSQAEVRSKRLGTSLTGRILIVIYTPKKVNDGKEKSFASSARARRPAKSAKPMPDSKLDFSDIPESTHAELRGTRRVGRPASGNAQHQGHLHGSSPSRSLLLRLHRQTQILKAA
jgi:uncharacterized DUF497 family protein